MTLKDERIQIIIVMFLLIIVGFIYVYSIGAMQAHRIGKQEYFFLFKQLISAIIGFLAMYIAYRTPLETYRKYIIVLYIITLLLLLSVFFFNPVNGASRWIPFPIFSFQPSEIAKVVIVLYLAHYLAKKKIRCISLQKGCFLQV